MSFVSPAYLWLLLAGALPVIIHLLNRQRYQTVRWAAMEFLLAASHKNRRRIQMENLLLLLLRVAIVLGLAFTFARPYLKKPVLNALTAPDTHLVIAIDNSYSMGYRDGSATIFEQVKDVARKLIDTLRVDRGDRLTLMTLSEYPETLINDVSLHITQAKKRVDELALTDYATNIMKTLALADDIASKSTASRTVIYLVTDNQKTGYKHAEAATATAKSELKIIEVGSAGRANHQVTRIYPLNQSGLILTGQSVAFQVESTNYGNKDIVTAVNFIADGIKQGGSSVNIGAGRTVSLAFNHSFTEPGPHWVRAEIEKDNLVIDDSRIYALDIKDSIKTLIINGEPSAEPFEDEVVFLRYALSPQPETPNSNISPYALNIINGQEFISTEQLPLNNTDVMIIANLEFIPPGKLRQIEEWLNKGGGLLIFLGDKVDRTAYNDLFAKGLLPAELVEVAGNNTDTVRFDRIDFTHPALTFFGSVKEKLRSLLIQKYYSVKSAEGSRVLMSYGDTANSPAVIEKPVGKGRPSAAPKPPSYAVPKLRSGEGQELWNGEGWLILVTTSADAEWNKMPAKPSYVMLIDQLCRYLASSSSLVARDLLPAQTITLPAGEAGNFLMATPKSGTVALQAPNYKDTADVGLYTLERLTADRMTKEKLSYFGVNPEPAEGDLRRIAPDELRKILNRPFELVNANAGLTDDALASGGQIPPLSHLWKYLIYLVLISLVLELVLAQRFGRFA
ncbi:MAG: BatA domain-containing protein [Planctomycetes bacterium]|nr:BatA domain-containing protein [Planctomycetota bacterium]